MVVLGYVRIMGACCNEPRAGTEDKRLFNIEKLAATV